jgi:formylglycine-generating enzyme required for sulfatase activity
MTNCGPEGSGTESCCTSLEVTGGTFFRTYDVGLSGAPIFTADGGPTGEADPATISTFRLDKYVVTVGRFRQFLSAWDAGWLPAAGSGKHTHLNGGNGLAGTTGGFEPGWAYEVSGAHAVAGDVTTARAGAAWG